MFNSISTILKQYSVHVSRYDFMSVEAERSENQEDMFYTVITRNGYYVVCESDYFVDMSHIARELLELYPELKDRALSLLVLNGGTETDPIKILAGEDLSGVDTGSLVYKDSTYAPYKYVVFSVEGL